MSIFNDIVDGWYHLIIKDPATEEVAKERSKICSECEKLDCISNSFYLHCGKCGCYIPAKVRSKSSKCPLNLW